LLLAASDGRCNTRLWECGRWVVVAVVVAGVSPEGEPPRR
jgi:hypothetical protein